MLTKGHINHISNTIQRRQLKTLMLKDELIDFVSCSVEERMNNGETFDYALGQVMLGFEQKDIQVINRFSAKLQKPNIIDMFKNYLKIALRGFVKHKVNSVVNVMGLVLSLSSVLVIGLYIQNEVSYDKFHKDVDRIYRVNSTLNNTSLGPSSSSLLRNAIIEEVGEVEQAVSKVGAFLFSNLPLEAEKKHYNDYRFAFVQEEFFSLFNFPITLGPTEGFYDAPFTLLVSTTWATRLFGNQSPLGKVISIPRGDVTHNFTIVGVFEDVPVNSHFNDEKDANFDMLSSSKTYEIIVDGQASWGWRENLTYVKLKEGATQSEVEMHINELLEERNINYKNHLQPVADIHLNTEGYEIQSEGSLTQVYTFALIGLLILVIACINYINLATARVTIRTKEMGVRKVLGAGRRQFLFQFIVEAFLVSTASLLISILLVGLSMNKINNALDLNLILSFQENRQLIVGLFLTMTIISVVSGGYPGLYLSRFKTTNLLKATISIKGRKVSLRKVLVVLQFGISASIIVCTILIVNQLNFMRSKDLGIDREHIVYVPISNKGQQDRDKSRILKDALAKMAEVNAVSLSGSSLGIDRAGGNGVKLDTGDWRLGRVLPVDFEYMNTLGIELKEGRWFDPNLVTDVENGFVVNEAFVKHYVLENPIGIRMWRNNQNGQIIGVVKDFHYKSMRTDIEPLVIFLPAKDYASDGANSNLVVKLNPGNTSQIYKKLEAQWAVIFPNRPFQWHFLDSQLEVLYRKEKVFGDTFKTFALIAIVVSCLGLLGLVSFSIERKFKEIGIRKVLGASVSGILLLLSKDFSKLVFLGLVISIPAAYFFINQWLDNFKYRIDIGYSAFVVAGLMTLIIAWLTVSYISVRAARANPVDSLKYE